MPERKMRIKAWMAWALIIVAICVDLAELGITYLGLVVVGGILSNILAIVAGIGFWIWFQILGIPMSSNTKRFAVSLISFLGEIIPGFDAIPFLSWLWTFGMIATVVLTRMEDRGESFSLIGALNEAQSFMTPMGAVASKIGYKVMRKPFGSSITNKSLPTSALPDKVLYGAKKEKTEKSALDQQPAEAKSF